jgi:glycosyltransferase involved in cell wall biosynthesis
MHVALNGWFWHRPETGSGQYIRRLVNGLRLHSPESDFLVFLPTELSEEDQSNLHFVSVPIKQTALNKVFWEQNIMPRLAIQHGANLLHTPYWAPPFSQKIPNIVTIHDLIPLLMPEYHGNALVRIYTAFVSATTFRASMILTDSIASLDDIHIHLHIPETKIRAIHLAVDSIYHPNPEPNDGDVLQSLSLQPGYILYLGGFDRRKNLGTVVNAFKIVRRTSPQTILVIAGKPPENDSQFTPDPRRLATQAGLSENEVRILGFVPESMKPALYRNACVFVFPSIYEGFGYPPLEALACGIPVVGSETSSLPEVVGDAGVLLPPDDTQGMADAIIHIITDQRLHIALCARAIQQATQFTWQNTAARTFEAYKEIIHNQN